MVLRGNLRLPVLKAQKFFLAKTAPAKRGAIFFKKKIIKKTGTLLENQTTLGMHGTQKKNKSKNPNYFRK